MKNQSKFNINKMISESADDITNYLLPKLYCLDSDGEFFSKIKKEASWIENINDADDIHSVSEDEVVIIYGSERFADEHLVKLDKSGRAIILCINETSVSHTERCNHAVSIRLITPSIEEVIFHLQAMLIVQRSMLHFSINHPLFTLSDEFNASLNDIAQSFYEKHPIVIHLNDLSTSGSWYHYLFDGLPARLKPEHILNTNEQKTGNSQYCISTNDVEFRDNHSNFVLFTQESKLVQNLFGSTTQINLSEWNANQEDHFIRSYLASAQASFDTLKVIYHNDTTLTKSYSSLVTEILDGKNVSFEPPKQLKEFIEKKNRLSLTNIILEIEYCVLNNLKQKINNNQGVSLAAGIKIGTLQKKIQRFNKSR